MNVLLSIPVNTFLPHRAGMRALRSGGGISLFRPTASTDLCHPLMLNEASLTDVMEPVGAIFLSRTALKEKLFHSGGLMQKV